MATEQQLIEGLRRADAAGNVDDAQMFANALKELRSQTPPAQPQTYGSSIGLYDPNNPPTQHPLDISQGTHDAIRSFVSGAASLGTRPSRMIEQTFTGQSPQTDAFQAQNEAAMAKSPIAGKAGQIAGGLAIPGGEGLGGAMASGATFGFLTSQADNTRGLAFDTALGGLFGMLGYGAAKGGAKVINKLSGKAPKSAQSIEQASKEAYAQADAAGLVVKPEAFTQFVDDAANTIAGQGTRQGLHPETLRMLKTLADDAAAHKQWTLNDLDLVRQEIGVKIGEANSKDARLLGLIKDHLDDFIGNLTDAQVTAGNAAAGTAALKTGRSLWNRYKKVDLLDNAFVRAEDRAASTYAGGNYTNALRQEVRRLIDNPKLSQSFDQTEIEALRKAVRGNFMSNAARAIGSWSRGLKAILMTGGSAAVGGPGLAMATTGATIGARKIGESMTAADIASIRELIAEGGKVGLSPAEMQTLATLGFFGKVFARTSTIAEENFRPQENNQ